MRGKFFEKMGKGASVMMLLMTGVLFITGCLNAYAQKQDGATLFAGQICTSCSSTIGKKRFTRNR